MHLLLFALFVPMSVFCALATAERLCRREPDWGGEVLRDDRMVGGEAWVLPLDPCSVLGF